MNVKHFILTTLLPPASLTIALPRMSLFQHFSTTKASLENNSTFSRWNILFCSFVCLKNPATNNTKMTKNKIISTWKHSWLKNKLSTSRTQQKDCWLFHSAGILYKITYIPTSNKMSLHFTNIL